MIELQKPESLKFPNNKMAVFRHFLVLKNQKTGSFELMVANDLEFDQSYSLAKLEQKHLENLKDEDK